MPWFGDIVWPEENPDLERKEVTAENVMAIVKELEGVIHEGQLLSKTLSTYIDKLHLKILPLPSTGDWEVDTSATPSNSVTSQGLANS